VNKKFGLGLLALLIVGVVAGALAVQRNTELQQHASLFNDLNTAGEIDKTNNPDGTMGPATWEGNFSNTLPAVYLGSLNFQVTDPEQGKRPTDFPTPSPFPGHATPTPSATITTASCYFSPESLKLNEGQTGSTTVYSTIKNVATNNKHVTACLTVDSAAPSYLFDTAIDYGNYPRVLTVNASHVYIVNLYLKDPKYGDQSCTGTVVGSCTMRTHEAEKSNNGPQTVTALTLVVTKVEVHLARLGVPGAKNQVTPTPHVTGKPSGTPGPRSDNDTDKNDNQSVNKWEVLNIGGTQTVDLVQLAKTKAFASLGLTKLANGFYTEVRLYIKNATATLANGTKVDLTIPGKANIVRVVGPFTIDSSKTTTLSMDFDAQNSVIKAGSKYLLKPVVAKFNQTNQQ
jgi:hypothetical protein